MSKHYAAERGNERMQFCLTESVCLIVFQMSLLPSLPKGSRTVKWTEGLNENMIIHISIMHAQITTQNATERRDMSQLDQRVECGCSVHVRSRRTHARTHRETDSSEL